MSEDQFTKIFNYIEKRFDEVSGRFDKQDHKINRLEKYIQVLAEKAGVDLGTIHV
jgi:tetrahydromethanopterin S-methyltransferase subunit G